MNIKILGCYGSQLPGANATAFLLNGKILVDAGTVTSILTLEEQVNIGYILVTHPHIDHVRDIMFLADNICYLNKDNPLVILSTQYIIDALRTYLFNGIIWPDFSVIPTPENPVLKFEVIRPREKVRIDNLDVTAIRVHHVVETVGYVVESREGSVIFAGDTGPTDEIWKIANRIKNLKAIFVETSLPDSMRDIADMSGHLTPSSLEHELKKLDSLKTDIYLYHMKLQYHQSIQDEVTLIKNRKIHVLKDGQAIQINSLDAGTKL
ncbi:MAG: 3',5'-cyclic-nucleotide phosphodiesterase [Syntrophales bacterium]|nr:3',5'-cyclic-nucleotide phosphodiesterase [Syntrophales bacterium]